MTTMILITIKHHSLHSIIYNHSSDNRLSLDSNNWIDYEAIADTIKDPAGDNVTLLLAERGRG